MDISSRILRYFWLFSTFELLFSTVGVASYRMGDVVDTEISLDASPPTDVLRAQMPRFGRPTRATVQLPSYTESVALTFEEGLWGLPTFSLTNNRNEVMNTVLITFVYSRSGVIHSVQCKPTYRDPEKVVHRTDSEGENKQFRIRYRWVEESAVSVIAGQAIMYVLVFVAAVFYLIISCGVFSEDEDEIDDGVRPTGGGVHTSSGGNGVPKWD